MSYTPGPHASLLSYPACPPQPPLQHGPLLPRSAAWHLPRPWKCPPASLVSTQPQASFPHGPSPTISSAPHMVGTWLSVTGCLWLPAVCPPLCPGAPLHAPSPGHHSPFPLPHHPRASRSLLPTSLKHSSLTKGAHPKFQAQSRQRGGHAGQTGGHAGSRERVPVGRLSPSLC